MQYLPEIECRQDQYQERNDPPSRYHGLRIQNRPHAKALPQAGTDLLPAGGPKQYKQRHQTCKEHWNQLCRQKCNTSIRHGFLHGLLNIFLIYGKRSLNLKSQSRQQNIPLNTASKALTSDGMEPGKAIPIPIRLQFNTPRSKHAFWDVVI